MKRKPKILLIDQHPEWLDFAKGVLKSEYNVSTLTKKDDLLSLRDDASGVEGFDLVFIGLELATTNLDTLKPLFKQWHFVVVFPILQRNETVRLLFKAGVYDCARKPYESESLLKLVADELVVANIANGQQKVLSPKRTLRQAANDLASMLRMEDVKNGETKEKNISSRR